jgi:hypothetical protein
MTTENLIPITVRIEPAVFTALCAAASAKGQEIADFASDRLTEDLLSEIRKFDPAAGKRLAAEIKVKAKAIEIARQINEQGFDPDVTIKVFQRIKGDPTLYGLYLQATGSHSGLERGNHAKARLNRNLGAAIKTAIGAKPAKTANGDRIKVQVVGELIFSYTRLTHAAP